MQRRPPETVLEEPEIRTKQVSFGGGIVWRAYVIDPRTRKPVSECYHVHRTMSAAASCARRLAGTVNRNRGTRAGRKRIPVNDATAGQLRTRIAFAAGNRAAAVTRLQVNWLIREHQAHDFELKATSGLGDGESFGIDCKDCELSALVRTSIVYAWEDES